MRFTNISLSTLAVWAVQFGHTLAQDKGSWEVTIHMDDFCDDPTGWYADNKGTGCFSFKGMPPIKSIESKGLSIGKNCGFVIYAYEGDNCTGEQWYMRHNVCHRTGLGDADVLKSFKVFETNHC